MLEHNHVCGALLARDNQCAVAAGGQFLRGVVERCQHLGPKMHTLVTMGAQHQGTHFAARGCIHLIKQAWTSELRM